MFTDLIAKIHNCSQVADILTASVESVKQALGCDRVVVYSLQPDQFCKVVAEAVTTGFPKTIETTIDDPCFKARHLESYRQGRISAIDNIYEARITPCHVETLEKIAVKANLVVPIRLPNDELYGLLILHQCDQPRVWKPEEITLSAQMAGQIGWAVDNAQRWSQCQKIQSTLDQQGFYHDLLALATQRIHQGNTQTEVLQIATAQAQAILTCDRAIVYAVTSANLGQVVAESARSSLATLQGQMISDPCLEPESIEKFQSGEVQAIDNIQQAGFSDEAVEDLAKIAVKASIAVPILNNQHQLLGLIVVHQCFSDRNWQDLEIDWLKQLGIQTGLALAQAYFQEQGTAMKSSLKRAGIVKDTITTADTQIQSVKESLVSSVENIAEAKHLMRLLSHEVVALTEKFSTEDINLIRIIAKKLQNNTEVATVSSHLLQSKITDLETAIDSANQVYKSRNPSYSNRQGD
jgi:GAF domain-containing protein